MARRRFLLVSLSLLLACGSNADDSSVEEGGCEELLCYDLAESVTVRAGARDLEIIDCDGDGHLDLIVANSDADTLSVARGNGDGTFASQETYDAGPDPLVLAPADFDGDGNIDLAVANPVDGASVLFGDGDCGFGTAVLVFGSDPLGEGSSGALAVGAGDIDGDGDDDVVAQISGSGADDAYVAVFPGEGDGSFGPAQPEAVGTSVGDVHAVDLDQDGVMDLAGITSGPAGDTGEDAFLHVLRGTADGTFLSVEDHRVVLGPATMGVAYFNEDGNLDVVTAGGLPGQGHASLLRGLGTADFATQVTFPIGEVVANGITVGDVDDDGRPDAVVALGDNSVAVMRGMGDGSLRDPFIFAMEEESSSDSTDTPGRVARADVDEDGLPDILATYSTGIVSVRRSVP
jgi:hypothetical protein